MWIFRVLSWKFCWIHRGKKKHDYSKWRLSDNFLWRGETVDPGKHGWVGAMGNTRQRKGTPGFRQWVEPLWEPWVSMSLWQPLGGGSHAPFFSHSAPSPSMQPLLCSVPPPLFCSLPRITYTAAGPSKKWKCEVPCSKIIKKKSLGWPKENLK